jgi:hypothetical protein
MPARITFLARDLRFLSVLLLSLVCLRIPAEAQHGGGGGHGGGGHFGGGHSGGGHSAHSSGHTSSVHSGGHHLGWLHLRSGHRSGNSDAALARPNAAEALAHLPSSIITRKPTPISFPSTYVASAPVWPPPETMRRHFPSAGFRRPRNYLYRHFPCLHPSGCFFNGFTQVCFFEPEFPLFFFSSDFGFWSDDFGVDPNAAGEPDQLVGQGMNAEPAPDAASLDSGSEAGSGATPAEAQNFRGLDLDKRFFLLILKNGATHVVTDYWVEDGYIEYISRDGTRSHIPIDALDLEATVRENSARGLPFVLRSGSQSP